ncbi:MAG: prolipoprotein diacylglyceryl transferase [Candidatus Omnitrophota bacterium]|nr:MAG: prolipoprotein diacylglyceryl transferase [Candidatus Omnitrophota bacterium]
MYPVLFRIGPLTIYTYGFFAFLGIVFGYLVCAKEAKRKQIARDTFSNIIFWTIVFGFVGARFLYVAIEFKQFLQHPLAVLFGRSGFVFYGGILSGFVALIFLTRKYSISFAKFGDVIALGIPLGHAFGRLGCFFYGCCYGRSTDSWIGVLFPPGSPAGALRVKVIPTQLISAFFLLLLFSFLMIYRTRSKFEGQVGIYYLLFYGVFRFIIEFFRADPRGRLGPFSTSQIIALFLIVVGIFLWRRWRSAA